MKNKLFALLLVIVTGVRVMIAEIYSGTCGTDLTWLLNTEDSTLIISGTGAMTNYSNSSAPWNSYRSSIHTVLISDGVISIGSYAFYECRSLASVEIPQSITSIGDGAFYYCSMTSVDIPNSVTSIGKGAFWYCRSLTSVTIPNSVTSIKDGTFRYCDNLTSIKIPNSVTSIGAYAFYGCGRLTIVTIPNSVTTIGGNAFCYCSMTSLNIPNSVTSIGECAFERCQSLTSVTIPYSVTNIGACAFRECNSLTNIVVDKGNSVYDSRDNCNAIIETVSNTLIVGCRNTIIPNSVTNIGNWAFYCCHDLTSLNIPNSVTSIGECAFKYCDSLAFIEIPNSVTSIGESAFEYCRSLTSVTIPNSVTSMGKYAFKDCDSLAFIEISNSVTSIGDGAFEYCHSLTSVTIPNSVTSIGKDAFYGCDEAKYVYCLRTTSPSIYSSSFPSGITVIVPNGCKAVYESASNWKNFTIKEDFYCTFSELAPTSSNIYVESSLWDIKGNYIISVGIEGGETFAGNIIETTGLDPEHEYNDISVVLTSNTSETETVNVSFFTSALELKTQPSKAVSSNTAILLAQTNMADIETSCGFEYKRNDAPEDFAPTKVFCPVASGQMAGRLKGLKDDVYYKYRAFYQSSAGNMYYGDWQYIFTGDVTVEFDPILYTYAATIVHENDATITGYALAGAEDFTEQGFEYWADSRVANNAPVRVHADLGEHFFVQASGIRMSVTLTNLDAGTNYKYRAYGKVGNQYYYGSEQSFTTQGEYVSPEAIEIASIEALRATKILRDGQILIQKGNNTYTITGQKIK